MLQKWQDSKQSSWLSTWLWMLLKLPRRRSISKTRLPRPRSALNSRAKSKLRSPLNNKLSPLLLPLNTLPTRFNLKRQDAPELLLPTRAKLSLRLKSELSTLLSLLHPMQTSNKELLTLKDNTSTLLLPARLTEKSMSSTALCRQQELPLKSRLLLRLKRRQCCSPLWQELRLPSRCSLNPI